ncbi:uncharacterized protein LOC135076720 [Ostrinia nubilalis]|uniref:uncharacterized protein LOC135076720 n=1 Tax=Ostrinia nubilalis TaxID=29057 RepID=UPI003082531D
MAGAAPAPRVLGAAARGAAPRPRAGRSVLEGVRADAELVGTLHTFAEPDDWCWRALRALRLHRACWGLRPEAPPPDPEPDDLFSKACALMQSSWGHCIPLLDDLFSKAYALMQSSWGHCIPLICSSGVAALCSLAATRAQDAVHCLAPLMLVLVDSPESVASTSKFTDLFSLILGAGGLVARALGRGSPGAALLARLVHEQLAGDSCGGVPHSALVRVWICALWRPAPGAAALLDAALRPRDLWQLNEFAQHQNEDWVQQMSAAIRASSSAPLLSYAALGAWLVRRELAPALLPRLEAALLAQRAGNQRIHVANALNALLLQRAGNQRIHVANALNLIGSSTSAEDLVIYKTAAAILGAPMAHFAHLLLWALLMQLYLSRGPGGSPETPAVGPLFFSGIIKSRTLAQLKRRLQDSIKYHQSEQKRLASENPEPTTPAPNTSRVVKSESRSLDGQLMPLSINDLTCESSDSTESDDSEVERVASRRGSTEENDVYMKNVKLAIKYHAAAESMLGKYAEWLDAGDTVRARQTDADVSRLLPERLQEAMWEVARRRVTTPLAEREPLPLPPPAPEAPPPAPATPYDTIVRVLMDIKNTKPKRSRRPAVKSPVDKVDFKDIRSLLSLVESHCQDLQKLAKESNAEVSTLANLNIVLWKLVQEQRVAKPLPVMRKYCSQRCTQVTYAPTGHEWCIAVGAVQGIKENRAKAMACTRRLARPRPHAARTAAALFTIVRRIPNREAAGRVAELALQAAARAGGAAAVTLAAFVEQLAERWLSSDGVLCSYLIRRSYNNSAAQTLIGPLVAPPRVDPAHIPTLHSALLRGPLPPSALFSYLSRFDMSRWADTATPAQRSEVLNELTEAAQRWAARDEPDYQVLLELVGMQSAAACRASELAALASGCCRAAAAWLPPAQLSHVARAALLRAPGLPCDQLAALASGCCRAAAAWLPPAQLSHVARAALLRAPGLPCDQLAALASGCCRAAAAWLPPAQLSHVARAALLRAPGLPCDQLGHLLRELGVIWWEVRSGLKGPNDRYAAYAPHVAQLLSVLHRAFVAAAVQLSYAPERVAALAWSSLLEAWSAWVVPHAATPLLPSTGEREHYTCMLRAFHGAALEVMADCPGTEEHLLSQIFEWAVQTCASVHRAPNQESRVQASALLAELARGPWRSHQWLRASSLQALLQVCHLGDRELSDWCAAACDGLQAYTWAAGEAELGARLPLLLHLFTAGIFQNDRVSQKSKKLCT